MDTLYKKGVNCDINNRKWEKSRKSVEFLYANEVVISLKQAVMRCFM